VRYQRYNAVNVVFIAVNNESLIQYSAVHILYPYVDRRP